MISICLFTKLIPKMLYFKKCNLNNFIFKKWINSAVNCEIYSSSEGLSSDHRIVTAKLRLSLRRNKKQTVKTTSYDWSALNNKDISNKYKVTIRNKFDTIQEIS